MSEKEKNTPFDFIKSVSSTKKDIFTEDSEYSAYMVNKGLSYFMDTILYANQMNVLPNISPRQNYDYYMNSIRKKDRFSKWHKSPKDEKAKIIMDFYECNYVTALQYLNCMSHEDFDYINKLMMGHK